MHVIFTLAARLFSMQVVSGGDHQGRATANMTVLEAVAFSRGPMVDPDGHTLLVNVPAGVARLIAEDHLELPGVQALVDSRRDYTYGSVLSQVLGSTGPIDAAQLQDYRNLALLRPGAGD